MISVMATRCKHCGEKVSRPKSEEERFSIQDLGGVSQETYKMSDSVIGALEAFRTEELNSPNIADEFHTPTSGGSSRDGMKLDAEHKALADAVTSTPQERARRQAFLRPAQRQDDTLRNAVLVLGGIGLAIVVIFGGVKLKQHFTRGAVVSGPVRINNALIWLNDGRHTKLEALEEAVRALEYGATPENERIAETVRDAVEAEIRALLSAAPWERDNMSQASAIANRAGRVDADRRMADLRREVQREVAAFKMVLTRVDEDAGTALFTINNPYYSGEKTQTVEVGGLLADRFIIRSIRGTHVDFTDSQVMDSMDSPRRLSIRVLDPVRGVN